MLNSKVLILRTCDANMKSYNGFVWPSSGPVECPDWKPTKECGNGLHGWLWGEGDGALGNWSVEAKWLVVEVDADSVIDLDGKVKFPRGEVVFCGTRFDATNYLYANGAQGKAVIGGTATTGHYGTATAGDYGTATAGYKGTATTGDYGTSTSGHNGTSTSGHYGTATAGYYGTATTGHYGTATSGHNGTATAGDYGTATAGYNGVLQISSWDSKANRHRINTAYVGENGILPNTPYRFSSGKWEAVAC